MIAVSGAILVDMVSRRIKQVLRSPRTAVSVLTVLILLVTVYLSREELLRAWSLLEQVNLWILALLIPFQIIVYYAGGEMIFSYLRRKKLIAHISRFEQTRIALELNLVNHLFPSGGVSGISYATWRLHKLGVSSSRSTFAQVVRYATGFLSVVVLLVIAVVALAFDGAVNRHVVGGSALLVGVILTFIIGLIFVFSSERRMHRTAAVLSRIANGFVKFITFGRVGRVLSPFSVEQFFLEMHKDFRDLSKDKRSLVSPLIWGAILAIFDVGMFVVAFWAFGESVNPAFLLIGYGVAGMASIFAFTPGGAGVYELVMIFFLTMAGVSPGVAIAGIVLTRVILLAGTILFGYIFYQHALIKYGKRKPTTV